MALKGQTEIMRHFYRLGAGWLALSLAALASIQPASAQDPVADFYKGKTLRIVIGYAPGGGYDIYGRVFAESFGKFVPGNPTIIAQNMTGAGSFIAAKYLYAVAPQDGTTFGSLAQTLPLDYVVIRIGGEAPYEMLRRAGVSIVMKELSASGSAERAVA